MCLIPKCADPFIKFFNTPNKDFVITTPEIDHFSNFHMGMEEDVLMYNIKAGKSICDNKKAQNQLQFDLMFGPKIKTEFKNENSLKPPPRQVQL